MSIDPKNKMDSSLSKYFAKILKEEKLAKKKRWLALNKKRTQK
jgi:hypothetical protein